jgi:ubiquinone/menaquinone biosynthesis C-methylase UbiE
MAPFNHFDLLAPYYDRFIKPSDLSRFCAMAGLPAAGLLLDVGGGTGQKSFRLLPMVNGIVIVDSSMGMLGQASKKGKVAPICSQSEQLPFEDETFERVIMVDALHHVGDYRVTTGEMWRVVKPGGRIVIEEPDIRATPVKIIAMIEKIALMRSHFIDPSHIASSFSYPNAQVTVEIDTSIAWIIVDKKPD